jgi:RimJ/RimL family protein N-acetyltransferase
MKITAEPRHALFAEFGLTVDDDAVFIGNEKGAVAFTRYTGEDVELHFCGHRGWATKGLMLTVYKYIWDVMECRRCTIRVREDREDSLRINMRMGFKVEGYMRCAEKGLGVWVLGMLREECRYEFTEASEGAEPDRTDCSAGTCEPD